ncbi:MAG: ATP-dependent helicase/nuclease subunit A [Cryomorphaceae bacterium]|jgi:ATP-dependent helicase/nuclease subunit A
MIRASAGSGKTWQLANRYLALLVLGVVPEKIIALTFTKKAAGEFSDRILTRLAEGAQNDLAAEDLRADIKRAILGDEVMPALVEGAIELPDMDVDFFRGLLKKLVDSIDRLALSTLDSFFIKLLRNFAFELGMSGFELLEGSALETEKVKVFADIFNASTGNKNLAKSMEGFVQAFRQTSGGDEAIRVNERLRGFVDQYQQRWLKYPNAESWGNEKALWPDGLPWYGRGGYAAKSQRVITLLEPIEFPDKRYKKALLTVAEGLQDREGKAGTPINLKGKFPLLLEHLEDLKEGSFTDTYYKKEMVVDGELAEALYDLLSTLVADEIIAKLERTRGVYEVIQAYEDRYSARVRGQGKLGFSDTTLLLSGHESMGLWDEVSKDLVEFRFDGKYDHWMLDEFQDTSRPQWDVIRNLIDEVVNDIEGERSLFVVGDAKQGIYGWRGGEPKLFDELAERYCERLNEYPMDKSWRSSESVLQLVNKVCHPQSKGMRLFPHEAVQQWKFQDHVAALTNLSGHSWVCEMDQQEDLTADQVKMGWIGELVKNLDPVRRGLSCAILVRKNSRGREIAEYLREHHSETPVAVEDELLVGEENPVTAVLVDAFRFLCYPNDTLAWWHVQMSPFAEVFGGEQDVKQMLSRWYFWTREISVRGVDVVLNKWCAALTQTVALSDYSIGRMTELRQAAADFSMKGGNLTEWLSEVESWKQREVTRKGVVQIMTVHKAKGLGFDTVLLPDLENSGFDDESRVKVIESVHDGQGAKHVLMAPVKDVRNADAVLRQEMECWSVDQCYEQFCVLYVMLTRAVHGTYCLLDAKKNKPKARKKNEADWMRESVAGSVERDESLGEFSGRLLFEHGSWDWLADKSVRENDGANDSKVIKLTESQSRQASVLAGGSKRKNFSQMMMDRGGLEYGDLVHQCFESIQWWEGELHWSGDEKISALVLECIDNPKVKPFFESREGLKVYREQPIESILDGVWVSGVIDRLLVEFDEEGKALNAAIMDFKTDIVGEPDELVDRYGEQLNRYKRMICKTYELTDENVYSVMLSTHLRKTINL